MTAKTRPTISVFGRDLRGLPRRCLFGESAIMDIFLKLSALKLTGNSAMAGDVEEQPLWLVVEER